VKTLVIEAIGPYSYRLLRALRGVDLSVGVVNPQRIRAWRAAEGKRAKNDRLDAQAIARFAQKMPDVYRPIPDEASLKIKAMSARRRQIVEMIAMEKTRLKQAFDDELLASLRQMIALLEAQRDEVEARLNALLREAGRGDMLALLQTAPGVGPRIAATLAADMPELGHIGRRAAASLAGLAPHIQQSGINRGRASISGGRPCVRTALYMAALVASRSHPRTKAEYKAMLAAGKPPKVAFVAIARKLLVALNQMVAEKKPWTEDQKLQVKD
jgi:transposase